MSVVRQRRGADYLIEATDPEDVLTPEDMDDEQRLMMKSVRDFAAREVEPVMDEVDARNIDVIRPLFKKAAELGIFMAEVPEEYGGLELSVLGIAGMTESRSYLGGLSSTVFAHQGIGCLPLINFGTQEQIDKYLEKLMQGDMMAAFALTEPSAGSDAMNIKTTATLSEDGTHYVLNGSKQFITNAAWADLFILFAKVGGTQFTAFLMEGGSEGLTVLPNENLLGTKGSSVCGLSLEDVKIPVENILGEIGKGTKVALCSLNLGRLKMATNCVGGGKKALECATQYTAERQLHGHALADFGLTHYKLAEMAARLYATQSMAYRTAGLVYKTVEEMPEETRKSIDARLQVLSEFAVECAMSKVHGTEMVNKLADDALQLHGGYGYSEEYAPARMTRDWRIARIYEGTSEVCRLTSTKTILKKSARGELNIGDAIKALAPPGKPDSGEARTHDLAGLHDQVADLKKIYLHFLGQALDRIGYEPLLDNDKQQFLTSLADVAIEIYAVESAVLRTMKLQAHHSKEATKLPEALVRLYFEYAADRIRQEATEVSAALFDGDELRAQLQTLQGWLPLPSRRLDLRKFVAESLVEAQGALPDFRN